MHCKKFNRSDYGNECDHKPEQHQHGLPGGKSLFVAFLGRFRRVEFIPSRSGTRDAGSQVVLQVRHVVGRVRAGTGVRDPTDRLVANVRTAVLVRPCFCAAGRTHALQLEELGDVASEFLSTETLVFGELGICHYSQFHYCRAKTTRTQ